MKFHISRYTISYENRIEGIGQGKVIWRWYNRTLGMIKGIRERMSIWSLNTNQNRSVPKCCLWKPNCQVWYAGYPSFTFQSLLNKTLTFTANFSSTYLHASLIASCTNKRTQKHVQITSFEYFINQKKMIITEEEKDTHSEAANYRCWVNFIPDQIIRSLSNYKSLTYHQVNVSQY